MKTAKRVLAIIVSVIMIVGTCAVAVSAAEPTLQEKINAAPEGGTVQLTKDTNETVTVKKNLTIDLNGYRLLSVPGQAAIKVTKGEVTVTNGQVISVYPNVPSAQMLQEVWTNSPPAIRLTGGKLTLDGVRVVGGMVRVPTTTDQFIPSGSGVQSYNGATVTIKRSSIYGDYGVNNKLGHNTVDGGVVTIEDAIILAYTKAVKGEYEVADGSEAINAAGRIAGILNDGITLEPKEQQLITNVFDERVIIVTKTADQLISELDLTLPTVTVMEGIDQGTFDPADYEIDYTWENTKGTDCSYKLVPESIRMADGTECALDAIDATRLTEAAKVRYRVEFKISDEARPYIEALLAEGLDNPLDGCLAWAGAELDRYYAQIKNNTRTSYVDSYQELIDTLGTLWYDIDSIGNEEIPTVGLVREQDLYIQVRQILVDLGGKVAYESDARREFGFNDARYKVYYGDDAVVPANGMYGLLDRVEALRVQMEAITGGTFTKTAAWGTLAAWAYDNYEEVLDIAHDLQGVLARLNNLLDPNDDVAKAIISFAHADDAFKLLGEGVENVNLIVGKIDELLENNDVKATLSTIERNKDLIKPYTDKVVEVITNWRTYVTPEEFVVDDTYVKTYSTLGSLEIIPLPAGDKLHVKVLGEGGVRFAVATENGSTITGRTYYEQSVDFVDTFTLTAIVEDEDVEFLFWVNKEDGSNRILSTEPTFRMNTNISRDIEAVFGYKSEPNAYFTNTTGDLCGNVAIDEMGADASAIDRPYIVGYGFEGWPSANSDKLIPKSALDAASTTYFAGNSVFADPNAYYGEAGAIMLVRPTAASIIVTPVYSINGTYDITFIDGDQTFTATGKYSDIASITSQYGADAYWTDENGNVVSVTGTYDYHIIRSATFTSHEGPCPAGDTVARVSQVTVNGDSIIFYVERSTTKAFQTQGILYSLSNSDPKIGGAGVGKATEKFDSLCGVYAPSFYASELGNRTLYVRPYIEYASGEPYYGPVFTYPADMG